MMLHWPWFTWKFLKLFLRKPSCPRNICTEHWRKLPNLIAFLKIYLYLKSKNNDFVKNVSKVLLNVPFIYFTAYANLPNSSCHFWKHKSFFLQTLHQSSLPSNITPLHFFLLKHCILWSKEPIKVQIFEIFECLGQNLSNSSFQFWNEKSIPLQILHYSSLSWHITL